MTWRTPINLAVAIALAIAGAACGGGNDAPAPQAAMQSTTQNQMNPMPRDQVQDGGTFTWPLDGMPANYNYYQIDGTEYDGYLVIAALMPSVYLADATGTPYWNPNYLASEPALETTPAQVVTYEINPKARWSDGTPITWEDFYWQWKASNGTSSAYRISASQGYEDIANVERGKDDREVVVTFNPKFADWRSLFNPLYPASTNKSPEVFNEGWKDQPLTTAGPFKLGSINQTSKTITVVRDDAWWGPPAKLDRIVFRIIEPDAQIDALANGEIDYMDVGTDASKYNRARAIADVDIRAAGGPNFGHITFNGTSPNLQDVRVRRAIAKGIDRTTIVRALLGPLGITPMVLNNHIYMANQKGYQDNSDDVGKFDQDAARQLLDQAGWTLDGKVRRKDGRPLQVSFVIPSGISTSRQVAELVQNMLGQIGVTVQINTVPVSDFFDKYITPGQFDLTLFSWIGTPFPVSSSKSIYAKPKTNAQGQLEVHQNYARIGSDALDALFDEATQALDPAKEIEDGNEIDRAIWQEAHSLPLYQRPELAACKKTLANFGAHGFADIVYTDIGWTKQP